MCPLYVVEAVITAVPSASPVTVPPLTDATDESELDHVTVPPEGHVDAVNVSVSPSSIVTACESSSTP